MMDADALFYQDPFTGAIVARDGSFSVNDEEIAHAAGHYRRIDWKLLPAELGESRSGRLIALSACLGHAIGMDKDEQVAMLRDNDCYQQALILLLKCIEALEVERNAELS